MIKLNAEDLKHHGKYLGTGGKGRTRSIIKQDATKDNGTYVPSPVDVVSVGVEPVSYLASFTSSSEHYDICQRALSEVMESIRSEFPGNTGLMRTTSSVNDVDFNIMLSKVKSKEFLVDLESIPYDDQYLALETHLTDKE